MKSLQKLLLLSVLLALCLSLSGCSLLTIFLTGGSPDADLVIINDSPRNVGSLSLDYGDRTEVVSNANGFTLLERGESYGIQLVENRSTVTLSLLDSEGDTLCRCLVEVEEGVRLYATLREDLHMEVGPDWPVEQSR